VLAQLSRELFAAGVLPYYLHALDRLVREIHGAPAKVSRAPRLAVSRAGSHGTGTHGC
jgi:L-lysine 2,3-aminomutase